MVPVYPTNAPEECEWVAGNSEARVIVCEDAGQVAKITQVRDALPALEAIVVIDGPAGDADLTLDDLRARGRDEGDRDELVRRRDAVTPEDRCFIVYTSGTTGPPKGTVLTHGNCSSVGAMVQEIGFVTEEDVSYLYLPLAHVFALTVQIASFDVGTAIVYFGGDPKQIIAELGGDEADVLPVGAADLREALHDGDRRRWSRRRPRTRSSSPRRSRSASRSASSSATARRSRTSCAPPTRRPTPASSPTSARCSAAGVRQAVSGAAPIAPEILRFFYACGVPVLEG